MKTFFKFHQNNSGGSFEEPAVNLIVEAANIEQARERASEHITFCGDSGLYADYDDCGCCPCCGHRWSRAPWSDTPENNEELIEEVARNGEKYMGARATALIQANGKLETNLVAICEYIKAENPPAVLS